MYKILNWLFGWDYVAWANTADAGIARIHAEATGRVWYWRYKSTYIIDHIEKREQVTWLTCNPEKYGL